jgi:hypothetical protein
MTVTRYQRAFSGPSSLAHLKGLPEFEQGFNVASSRTMGTWLP